MTKNDFWQPLPNIYVKESINNIKNNKKLAWMVIKELENRVPYQEITEWDIPAITLSLYNAMQNMRRYIIENCFSYDTTEIVESFINNSLRNFLTTHKYLADQIKKDAINYGKNHLDVYNEWKDIPTVKLFITNCESLKMDIEHLLTNLKYYIKHNITLSQKLIIEKEKQNNENETK